MANNKNIFSENLKKYMKESGKTRKDVCEALGFSYFTFTSWVNGTKYPRMDKVEMLANYFGIQKSDLIEKKATKEDKKNSDVISDITKALFENDSLCSVVSMLCKANLDEGKLNSVKEYIEFQMNR